MSPLARSKEKRHGLRQAVGPDLVATRSRPEGVARWDRVGGQLPGVRVDAKDLAEQRFGVLAAVEGIASATAVAE